MGKEFDLIKYLDILRRIQKCYIDLKEDNQNEELYLNFKSTLNELRDLIDKKLIPSDLIYKSDKIYYDYYRLMETIYKKTRKNNI